MRKIEFIAYSLTLVVQGFFLGFISRKGYYDEPIIEKHKTEIRIKDSLYQKANGEILRHNEKYNCIEK